MNYFHIYNYNLIDYSDGSNGPTYDQNDWMEFYLPTFQKEMEVIEDPTLENPGTDRVVIEDNNCTLKGWIYNDSLTIDFVIRTGNWSPIEPVKCRWKIFLRNETTYYPSDRNVRLYAQPIFYSTIVQPPYWTLIFEGVLNADNSIDLCGLEDLIL